MAWADRFLNSLDGNDEARGRTVNLNPSAITSLATVEKEGFSSLNKVLYKPLRVRPVARERVGSYCVRER